MQVPLLRLQCGVNSYEWGKAGSDSAAARYAAATPRDGFQVESKKPYAELWMGTHPSNPSSDIETKRSLLDLVQDNQALMGQDIAKKYDQKLPFLFKVLSIAKALSIQAHPNKKLAAQLHKDNPKEYKDDNHKPEMTIAITPFEGLCGFRLLEETAYFLKSIKSLRALVGEDASKKFETAVENSKSQAEQKQALRAAFTSLMESKDEDVKAASKELLEQVQSQQTDFPGKDAPAPGGKVLAELLPRLNSQFPSDIGLFVTFFLNFVVLEPGEAMFLRADDIHAYISGDIIECMAASDNVVRAGFTPKFKDIPNLTSMLTYTLAPPSSQKMTPVPYPYCKLNTTSHSSDSSAMLYDPPIEEFAVVKTDLKNAGAKVTFEGIEGPAIIICTEGKGKISVGPKTEEVKEGYVYFVGATAECVLESTDGAKPFVTFRAFCELAEEGGEGKGNL
ncbi:Mannose-6-phosphate isomerase [Oleoguttula sp. CCFEE 5521]